MCYTGICPYECANYGSPSAGECMLKYGDPIPDDAECVLAERWLDEWTRKHPLKAFIQDAKLKLENIRWRLSGKDEIPF